jgi:hypothetical protein
MSNSRRDEHRPDDGAHQHDGVRHTLQEELRREELEGRDLLGDTSSNRNLSGSSTWATLPEQPSSDDEAGGTGAT